MESSNGEFMKVDFTSEELYLISQRAEFMAKEIDIDLFWQQMFWQLALAANHLSTMIAGDEPKAPKLEKYNSSLESADETLIIKYSSKKED